MIHFRNRVFKVGKPFVGQPVALRAITTDGLYQVCCARHQIKQIDLRTAA